jgi:hypothetical protein
MEGAFSPSLPAPPPLERVVEFCDWIELAMILSQLEKTSRADLRTALKGMGVVDDDSADSLEFAFQEVVRRKMLSADGYPFSFSQGLVEFNRASPAAASYTFLLLLSMLRFSKKDEANAELIFDNLVLHALRNYLGPMSVGVRFGTPASGDRPTRFHDALDWLSGHLGCSLGTGARKPPKRNDGGLDVVAWAPFKDRRMGYIAIMAQCTIQVEWRSKAKDIVDELWMGWLDIGRAPVTCLAVPFALPRNYEKWDEVRRTVTLILERSRLSALLSRQVPAKNFELQKWLRATLESVVRGKAHFLAAG